MRRRDRELILTRINKPKLAEKEKQPLTVVGLIKFVLFLVACEVVRVWFYV